MPGIAANIYFYMFGQQKIILCHGSLCGKCKTHIINSPDKCKQMKTSFLFLLFCFELPKSFRNLPW